MLISHEMFSGASAEDARTAVAAFAPRPVTVVVTARDLMRQVPAEWQENVKHGRVKTFAEFWELLSDPEHAHEASRWFQLAQDVPDIVARWAAAVSAPCVCVVTVPPSGAEPTLLWRRFAEACAIESDGVDLDVQDNNPSLDTVTTALLRRVNVDLLSHPLRIDQRDELLKGVFAHRVLAPQKAADARIRVPIEVAGTLHAQAIAWRKALAESGCTVVGDLDELVPPEPGTSEPDVHPPDAVPPGAVVKVAVASIARLLHELGRVQDERQQVLDDVAERGDFLAELEQERVDLQRRLDAAEGRLREHRDLPPGVRVRRLVVELSGQLRPLRWLLGVYRMVRGRRGESHDRPPAGGSGGA